MLFPPPIALSTHYDPNTTFYGSLLAPCCLLYPAALCTTQKHVNLNGGQELRKTKELIHSIKEKAIFLVEQFH